MSVGISRAYDPRVSPVVPLLIVAVGILGVAAALLRLNATSFSAARTPDESANRVDRCPHCDGTVEPGYLNTRGLFWSPLQGRRTALSYRYKSPAWRCAACSLAVVDYTP